MKNSASYIYMAYMVNISLNYLCDTIPESVMSMIVGDMSNSNLLFYNRNIISKIWGKKYYFIRYYQFNSRILSNGTMVFSK